MREGGPAERERLAQGLARQMDVPQQLAGAEHVLIVAGDEVGGGHLPRGVAARPQRGHAVDGRLTSVIVFRSIELSDRVGRRRPNREVVWLAGRQREGSVRASAPNRAGTAMFG